LASQRVVKLIGAHWSNLAKAEPNNEEGGNKENGEARAPT
jgi:hypothetical protein